MNKIIFFNFSRGLYFFRKKGEIQLVKHSVQRKEIFDLKKYVSEDIKNKNLLQGYRKVVEDILSQVCK